MAVFLLVMMRDRNPLVSVDIGEPIEDAVHHQLPVQLLLQGGGEEAEAEVEKGHEKGVGKETDEECPKLLALRKTIGKDDKSR